MKNPTKCYLRYITLWHAEYYSCVIAASLLPVQCHKHAIIVSKLEGLPPGISPFKNFADCVQMCAREYYGRTLATPAWRAHTHSYTYMHRRHLGGGGPAGAQAPHFFSLFCYYCSQLSL